MQNKKTIVGHNLKTPPEDITNLDCSLGTIRHLPPYSKIPNEFKNDDNIYSDFVSKWFFSGLEEAPKIKDGINEQFALANIKAVLMSFDPPHEHKIAGAAYMLSLWFDLEDKK